jgi:hypothetical protein
MAGYEKEPAMRGERRDQRRARRRARKEEGRARVDKQRELNELRKAGGLSKDEWKARSEELRQEALEIDRIRMIRHYEEKHADLVSALQAAGHRPSIGGEYRKAEPPKPGSRGWGTPIADPGFIFWLRCDRCGLKNQPLGMSRQLRPSRPCEPGLPAEDLT